MHVQSCGKPSIPAVFTCFFGFPLNKETGLAYPRYRLILIYKALGRHAMAHIEFRKVVIGDGAMQMKIVRIDF